MERSRVPHHNLNIQQPQSLFVPQMPAMQMQPTQEQYPPMQLEQQPAGADAHLQHLKDSFKQAANSLTQLYKQSSHSYNVAY